MGVSATLLLRANVTDIARLERRRQREISAYMWCAAQAARID
jgi:hypothetical protein